MARKVKGYIELYWKCPSCANENMGSHAFCTSCGSPQPQNVDFHQSSKQQLLTDAEKLRRAKAGADIHCGFCGTRNPAGAANCAQCGSDLKQGTLRASAGKVVGAFAQGAEEPVKCANCGTLNAGTRLKCGNCGSPLAHGAPAKKTTPAAAKPIDRNLLFIGAGVVIALCALVYFLFFQTQQITGVVTAVNWQRSVAIEAYGPVQLEGWRNELPVEAQNVSCTQEVSVVQSEPPATGNYSEVCGTEYSVDQGNGYAEIVQDCEYQVYEDYCSYAMTIWAPVATAQLQGFSLAVEEPAPALTSNQRLGDETSSYECIFDADGRSYTYTTSSLQEFKACVIGSTWKLTVNGAGAVTQIEAN